MAESEPTNPTDKTVDRLVSEIGDRVEDYEGVSTDDSREDLVTDATQEVLSNVDTVDEFRDFYEHVRSVAERRVLV